MALASTTVWEVRTTGDNDNGGGFNAALGGTDYSQQNAAQLTVTDAAGSGTTTLSSAIGGFTAAMVGNLVNIVGQGRYEIVARTDTNTVTVDRALGTFTGATAKVGGCLAYPGLAYASAVAGNAIWIKAGTYNVTSTTANVAGGRLSFTPSGGAYNKMTLNQGYETTRGDVPTNYPKFVVDAALSGFDVASFGGDYSIHCNMEIDASAAGSNVDGFGVGNSYTQYHHFVARGCSGRGIFRRVGGSASLMHCAAFGCDDGIDFPTITNCVAGNNSGVGITTNNVANSLSYGNGEHGFRLTTDGQGYAANCISCGNTLDGFSHNHDMLMLTGCIIYGNGGYGVSGADAGGQNGHSYRDCAFGNNTSGPTDGTPRFERGRITLTADPFVDATNDDYNLNDTAGGGALLRAVAEEVPS